jgi:alkanesulfonate monooxygenase SsuD/methylene tetrahydromethanopterin reductase-like flavin-dependent oxidoreductase (luciferase family)
MNAPGNPPFAPPPIPAGRLARLGVVLDIAAPLDVVQRLAILCDRAGIDAVWLADRLHIDRPGEWLDASAAAAVAGAACARARLGVAVASTPHGGENDLPSRAPAAAQELMLSGIGAGLRTVDSAPLRVSVILDDPDDLQALLDEADDVVLPSWRFPDLETAADEVRARARDGGRDPTTLGARIGHPDEYGIFGTLEECQDRVIALRHAGISDLRCMLPATEDLHDVIAQLTAITIGSTDVLVPGSLRSSAPPPPVGWGGRRETSGAPRVSGGSRRR